MRERNAKLPITLAGEQVQTQLLTPSASPSLRERIDAIRMGMRGAPWWWEFESELKQKLALEMLLRRMFAMVPQTT
jgi:hypothetical protein